MIAIIQKLLITHITIIRNCRHVPHRGFDAGSENLPRRKSGKKKNTILLSVLTIIVAMRERSTLTSRSLSLPKTSFVTSLH